MLRGRQRLRFGLLFPIESPPRFRSEYLGRCRRLDCHKVSQSQAGLVRALLGMSGPTDKGGLRSWHRQYRTRQKSLRLEECPVLLTLGDNRCRRNAHDATERFPRLPQEKRYALPDRIRFVNGAAWFAALPR